MPESAPPPRSLSSILPRGAVACELEAPDHRGAAAEDGLFAGERDIIADSAESRRHEFADGRACARNALALIGLPPTAIPRGADGAPVWPPGVVGSITHKGRYRAAAVAPAVDLIGLGIDAELDEQLPAGVLWSVAAAGELEQVEGLLAARPGICWDRLLFSAKEAVVKAVQPLSRGRPELRASTVRFDPESDSFTAVPRFSAAPAGGTAPQVNGRWLKRPELLIVVASVAPTESHDASAAPQR